ncbi:MAG: hypothetical protein JNN04_11635 [Cyclobacteriaceae bacterium]|nr:hypothetical protein [Cyclobacteriaceae bacterium]
MKYLVALVVWLSCAQAFAQGRGDSILLKERSIDRPVNVHRGQLRASGTYRLGLHTVRFDDAGSRIDLTEGGLSYASNTLVGEVRYGITEYLQASVGMARIDQAISAPTTYVIAGAYPEVNSLEVYNGWLDVSLGVDFRVPWRSRMQDLLFSLSATLPTADSHPDVPNHTVNQTTVGQVTAVSINYQYNKALGNGVPVIGGGMLYKHRWQNWAVTGAVGYSKATGPTSTSYWRSQYLNPGFTHQQVDFEYQRPDELNVAGEVEYQMFPWFDLIGEFRYTSSSGGYSEESGTRETLPSASLLALGPGFEIIITHRVWFRQRVLIPAMGSNTTGATFYSATISYNVFLR